MVITSTKIISMDCTILMIRVVRPLVVIHTVVCVCLAVLMSVIYWANPVAWPFLVVALLLTMSDIILVVLKNYCNKHYGRDKAREAREITTIFSQLW